MLTAFKKSLKSNTAPKSGVTLIEILIVSTIIAMLAAVSFPIFKIIQQREKERRLKKILFAVRSAIGGCKSQKSNKIFTEGFRNFVFTRGREQIESLAADPDVAHPLFIQDGTANGRFYPHTPSHICYGTPYVVRIATGAVPATEYVDVEIQRRFLRNIPPHPFKGWYPNAEWRFKASVTGLPDDIIASYTGDPWSSDTASGVIDIVSRGAGEALDGSRTDDW